MQSFRAENDLLCTTTTSTSSAHHHERDLPVSPLLSAPERTLLSSVGESGKQLPTKNASHRPLHIARYQIDVPSDLPEDVSRVYSRMKYGDPQAVLSIAETLVQGLMAHTEFRQRLERYPELYVASSAYGSIPTAAHAIMTEMVRLLRKQQHPTTIHMIKIAREGGFDLLDYSKLDAAGRENAMRSRRIHLQDGASELLKGKLLLVIDDLRSTGAHERSIHQLLLRKTKVAEVVFAYWISFQGERLRGQQPHHEERINHCDIRRLEDLVPLFIKKNQCTGIPICVNARLLKFILMKGLDQKGDLTAFLDQIGQHNSSRIYDASLSSDGYFHRQQFRQGFQTMEDHLFRKGWIQERRSVAARNFQEGKIVAYNITADPEAGSDGGFVCAASGNNLDAVVKRYSRFKFGDVEEIRWWGKMIATKMIHELSSPAGAKVLRIFETAKAKGEHVFLVAPGIRNVVSASNSLLREVGQRVNIWLSQRGLPTMIMKSQTRLGSGRANYAKLSAKERTMTYKTSNTLIPRGAYEEHSVHILFIDDVEVTGATLERARKNSLEAGALSFHAILGIRVDPAIAHVWSEIEQAMNQFEVCETPADPSVKEILSHPEYYPVQRMLRLLLHPEKRKAFTQLFPNLPNHTLTRVYAGAISNDYLWIHSDEEGELGIYGPSLVLLQEFMEERGLIDSTGQII